MPKEVKFEKIDDGTVRETITVERVSSINVEMAEAQLKNYLVQREDIDKNIARCQVIINTTKKP